MRMYPYDIVGIAKYVTVLLPVYVRVVLILVIKHGLPVFCES